MYMNNFHTSLSMETTGTWEQSNTDGGENVITQGRNYPNSRIPLPKGAILFLTFYKNSKEPQFQEFLDA